MMQSKHTVLYIMFTSCDVGRVCNVPMRMRMCIHTPIHIYINMRTREYINITRLAALMCVYTLNVRRTMYDEQCTTYSVCRTVYVVQCMSYTVYRNV